MGGRSVAGSGRWRLVVVVLLAAVLAAGCLRPRASGAEPERESMPFDAPIDGAPSWLNGTVRLSPLPGEVAGVASPDEPHNCFSVGATGEARSYLGGVVVDLEWTAASPVLQVLNLTVGGTTGSTWWAEGPSPLRLVGLDDEDHDLRTPFQVRLRPAGDQPSIDQQDVGYRLYVGVLESELGPLAWRQCGTVPPVLP